ncbi:MAG: hypothetical protein IJF12_00055, partial [Alphaproteobacteria bacterium]|nr:hypothetical protein [Alphaproteobacteria bacterium]
LFSAVALLATSTANATTDYAEVTAKATIEVAGTFECDDIDFGNIVVKQNNRAVTVNNDDTIWADGEGINDIISFSLSDNIVSCTASVSEEYNETVTLKNDNGDKMSLNVYGYGAGLASALYIPANVKAGEYTGSFTVTVTY